MFLFVNNIIIIPNHEILFANDFILLINIYLHLVIEDLKSRLKKEKDLYLISDKFKKDWIKQHKNAPSCFEIITHVPVSYNLHVPLDRIAQVPNGSKVIMNVTAISHSGSTSYRRNFGKKQVYQISVVTDNGEPIQLLFFKIFPSQKERLAVGNSSVISGKLEILDGFYRIVHPRFEKGRIDGIRAIARWRALEIDNIEKEESEGQSIDDLILYRASQDSKDIVITPIYKTPTGITEEEFKLTVDKCLRRLKEKLSLVYCEDIFKDNKNTLFHFLSILHNPINIEHLNNVVNIKRYIAALEIAANKIAIELASLESKDDKKIPFSSSGDIFDEVLKKLPFDLTEDQKNAIDEIKEDHKKEDKSSRLLQGDVGSGKTLVALGGILNAIGAQKKAIFVAPTTVLAIQHYRFISDMLFGFNIPIFLLIGKTTAKERKKIKLTMEEDLPCIVIGTHAVIESEYIKDCHFCIIDEQHRFGVQQRHKLVKNNPSADILMMTATPIPRTILLTMYDNVKISFIKEMPKSRKPVLTSVMSSNKLEDIMASFAKKVKEGSKLYWICPAVDINDNSLKKVISTEERYNSFKDIIEEDKLFLIHGKLKDSEKDKIMKGFSDASNGGLLIATSVVEVGIDVPDATVIAIEQSERFGLSQLHQLRGRVGRGHDQSYCLLIYTSESQDASINKLSIIRNSNDGFKISEEDFKLRGAGDLIGFRQSGYGNFKIANEYMNIDLLEKGKGIANVIINNDKTNSENNSANQIIPILLSLFDYNEDMIKAAKY